MDSETNASYEENLEAGILDDKYERNLGLIERLLDDTRLSPEQIAHLYKLKSMLVHQGVGKPDSHQLAQELSEELEIEHELAMVHDHLERENPV